MRHIAKILPAGGSGSSARWAAYLSTAVLAISTLLLAACVQPNSGPTTIGSDAAYRPAYSPPPRIVFPPRAKTDRWVGRGSFDACGNAWYLELAITGNRVDGLYRRGNIRYDIAGYLESSGRIVRVRGQKNRFFRNHIGPRRMEFNIAFGESEGQGEHYFENGRCLTPLRLTRVGE